MCGTDILFVFWYNYIMARERPVFSDKAIILFFQSFKELYVCTTIAWFELNLIEGINTSVFSFSTFLRYCIELCLISYLLPCDVISVLLLFEWFNRPFTITYMLFWIDPNFYFNFFYSLILAKSIVRPLSIVNSDSK